MPSPPRARRGNALVLAAAAIPALLAACGGGEDRPDVAQQLNAQVAKEVGLSAGDLRTTCPKDAEVEAGATFACHVEVDGQMLAASVSVGDGNRLDYQLAGKVVRKQELEDGLKATVLQMMGIQVAQLDCGGSKVVVVPKPGTIDCTGTSNTGEPGTVQVGLDGAGQPTVVKITNGTTAPTTGSAAQTGGGEQLPVPP
jgi:hypothetical protein